MKKMMSRSFLKIKTDDNRARLSRSQQNSKNSTAKPRNSSWPVNLSDKRRDIVGVHQRAAGPLQKLLSLFLLSQPDPSNVMTG